MTIAHYDSVMQGQDDLNPGYPKLRGVREKRWVCMKINFGQGWDKVIKFLHESL
jgi:hypothetical protein